MQRKTPMTKCTNLYCVEKTGYQKEVSYSYDMRKTCPKLSTHCNSILYP